jgi:hypothetical protein
MSVSGVEVVVEAGKAFCERKTNLPSGADGDWGIWRETSREWSRPESANTARCVQKQTRGGKRERGHSQRHDGTVEILLIENLRRETFRFSSGRSPEAESHASY